MKTVTRKTRKNKPTPPPLAVDLLPAERTARAYADRAWQIVGTALSNNFTPELVLSLFTALFLNAGLDAIKANDTARTGAPAPLEVTPDVPT